MRMSVSVSSGNYLRSPIELVEFVLKIVRWFRTVSDCKVEWEGDRVVPECCAGPLLLQI